MKYIMVLEHEKGHARHFGPLEDLDMAMRTAEAYFSYDNTPYTVSFLPLREPLGSEFMDCRRKDGEP